MAQYVAVTSKTLNSEKLQKNKNEITNPVSRSSFMSIPSQTEFENLLKTYVIYVVVYFAISKIDPIIAE